MPKPPPDPSITVEYLAETEHDQAALRGALRGVADVDDVHTLISRKRWEAWRELINGHGNAFAVGARGDGRGALIMAWDFLSRPITRAEAANLIAWLAMLTEVTGAEIETVCRAQGISLRVALELDNPHRAVCSNCGGELAAKCVGCGSSFP